MLFIAYVLLVSLPAPGEFPTSWARGVDGVFRPSAFAPAWNLPLAMFAVGLLVLAVSRVLDGNAARRGWRFNPLVVVDELIVAHLAAQAFAHLQRVRGRPAPNPWDLVPYIWAVAVPIALALEALRPKTQPIPETPPQADPARDERLAREIAEIQRRQGTRWVHWESQQPLWMRWGMPALGLLFLAFGGLELARGVHLVGGAVHVLIGVAMVLFSGGLRVSVSHGELTVRFGWIGWRVLDFPLTSLAGAEVHAFDPLRDFCGYGIRRNREMTAYFLRGDRGVMVTTHDGRKYLIGSDRPERLAAVIGAALRAAVS